LITNFAEIEDILMIGGPSGHGKSPLLLSLCRALLTQEPLFGYAKFQVPKPANRVLYLIPEVGLRAFRRRLDWFGLLPFVESERLFIRTQNSGPVVSLSDPVLLSAVKDSDVILDTAIRFSEGDESSSADNRDGLAAALFGLGRAGARSVICAHHAPKDFAKQSELTLENCLRGSGDIGAMLSTAYGIRQVNRTTNRILVQCIKPRDIEPLGPFEVQGRPYITDVRDFRVVTEPGDADLSAYQKKAGRPETPGKSAKMAQAVSLREEGRSLRQIAATIGVSKSQVDNWLFEHDSASRNISGQFTDTGTRDG
jgi:AAA domain-containing protein